MKKLLVTGASGFLGWVVCNVAKGRWQVYGLCNAHFVEIKGSVAVRVDLTDYCSLKACIRDIVPDAVIHTAAATKPNYCQEHPAASHAINVAATSNIAGLCADRNIPFVFTSSDLVFDGTKAPYKEEDPVNSVNLYGEQKVLAERAVLSRYPDASVCRMPLMFGDGSPAYSSFFQTMVNALQQGIELRLFLDEFRTPVSTRTAAEGIMIALAKTHGILHLGGRERISRYDFGVMLSEVMGVRDAKILRLRQQDMPMSAPRAADLSLDSAKAFALGYTPPPLREELKRLLQ